MKRRKQTRKHLKLISVLLVLCLSVAVLFSAPMTVSAEDLVDVPQNEPILTVPVEEVQEVGFGEYAILEGEEEPERVPVQRLYSEEPDDLYTKVWLNNDGTRTMKLYDHPVKYVTSDGDIEDISLDVVASTTAVGGYETEAGFAKTVFPSKVTDGISLSGNGVSVRLTPVLPNSALAMDGLTANDTVTLVNDQTVSYTYDAKTSLDYKLTYMGFKEDIVVDEYTGQTQYAFMLETNGLTLVNENGSYFLKDETGEIKATLGDIIVFTADEQNNTMGELTHTVIKPNNYYFLTIQLDAEWLSDENTAYPIRIDPTVEISYDNNGASAIEDVTINSNSGSDGSSGSLFVGKRDTYGVSRILMRFPGLDLSAVNSSKKIVDAQLEIRDVMCETTSMGVYSYIYDGNAWTPSTASWSNNKDGWTHFMSHNDISYSNGVAQDPDHRYKFRITDALKLWKTGEYSQSKGIMLKAKDDETMSVLSKTFASYNRSELRPSLTVTYTVNEYYHAPFGWFDAVSSSAVSGWVWCVDDPNGAIEVRAEFHNLTTGALVTTKTGYANIYRQDVEEAGYGDGEYGFRIPVDWTTMPAGEYKVIVKTVDHYDTVRTLAQSPRYYSNVGVRLNKNELTLRVGETFTLSATVLDPAGTDTYVTWSLVPEYVNFATVNPTTGLVTAIAPGIVTVTARSNNGKYSANCEVWVTGETPVILLHGRDSNSSIVWGATNGVTNNSGFDPSVDAYIPNSTSVKYTDKAIQDIVDFEDDNSEGTNLAYELKENGYTKNISLFVFNYPNEDAVIHSAVKLKKYIEELASYVKSSGTPEMKACFYASKQDYENNYYKVNLIGHSMGGLVARYYIENLYQDYHVDKLITICTPHWGSGYGELSNNTGIEHKLCDHDLDFNSAMYGGSLPTDMVCSALANKCYDSNYVITDELQYSDSRHTKYYAIVGVDFAASTIDENDYCFELPTNLTTYQAISDHFATEGVYGLLGVKIDVDQVGDNMVGLLSQMGWTGDPATTAASPEKTISMTKILINVDTDGGNSLQSLFHSKMPHREVVADYVLDYLQE